LLGPPFDAMGTQAGLVRLARVQDRQPDFPGQGLVVRASALERLRPALAPWLASLTRACEGHLFAVARVDRLGRQVAFARAELYDSERQRLIANATSSLMLIPARS
jgi:hypothetical protein